MRTIEKVIYNIEDVKSNKELKEKVLEKNWNINVEDDTFWSEPIIDWQIEDLEKLGYEDVKISFCGFYNQGDGASFTASLNLNEDVLKRLNLKLNKKELELLDEIEITIVRTNIRYVHENSTDVYVEYYTENKILNSLAIKLKEAIKAEIVELNSKIYKELKDNYEYLTEEDAILETLSINDYEFDEDGYII